MGYYLDATICQNGHTVSNNKVVSDKYCSICGAKTISTCPHCGNPIRGKYKVPNVVSFEDYSPPKYCYNCGNPFPWTERALETTKLMIAEDKELSDIDKGNLSTSLPDIIIETPNTPLAATRINRAFKVAGKFTADALRQFVIDFGCELAVRFIMK